MAPSGHLRVFFLICGSAMLSFAAYGQNNSIAAIRIMFQASDFDGAKSLLKSFSEGSRDFAEAQYFFGRIAVEEKDYELSVEKFEAAIDADPRVAEYHNWLGVMYGVVAMKSNPIKQAYYAPKIKNAFEKAATLDPQNLQTQWGLINYYTKAPGFLGGSWEKALAAAQVIAHHNPIQGLRAFAFIHAAQGKYVVAEKELLEALRSEPADWENTFALAQFYCEQKKFDRAIALYDGYIKKYPSSMVTAFYLGVASAQSGFEVQRGITCLTHYLAYTPRPNEPAHSDAQLNLGLLYEKRGDLERARKCFQESLKLEPGMREARERLERLN